MFHYYFIKNGITLYLKKKKSLNDIGVSVALA